jgi:hypothetical protein
MRVAAAFNVPVVQRFGDDLEPSCKSYLGTTDLEYRMPVWPSSA